LNTDAFLDTAVMKARSASVVVSRTVRSGTMPPPPITVRPLSVRYARRRVVSAADDALSAPVLSASASASVWPGRYGFWMERPDGVYHLAVVNFRKLPPDSR